MEMAENVGRKKGSFINPESFDSKFGDSQYLMTNAGKSRLRGYLSTFGYMMLCGLLLLIGGGTFFIYESALMKHSSIPPESDATKPSGRLIATNTDITADQAKLRYVKEFQIAAFVFIAVGLILFMVGAPLTGQFYRRYRQVKNSERSPILEDKKGKSRIFNPKNGESTFESMAHSKKKKNAKPKRKPAAGWMNKSKRRVSEEGFRFAAHRHPSMNQISIDGGGFFDRRFSDNSSDDSDDLPTIAASPQHATRTARRIGGFFSRLFASSSTEDKIQIIDREETKSEIGDEDFAKSYEEIGSFGSTERSEDRPDGRSGRDNSGYDKEQDGLYNLGQ